ncbi:MAG TPA: hypothetical protein PK823_04425 [Novosphingobium sp.]|jgi:hypothetical protein|nr:hypothetical protein [Novosphingobium sp.]
MATIQFQDIPGNTGRYRNVAAITGYYHYVPLIPETYLHVLLAGAA